jgi:hypothetical protein
MERGKAEDGPARRGGKRCTPFQRGDFAAGGYTCSHDEQKNRPQGGHRTRTQHGEDSLVPSKPGAKASNQHQSRRSRLKSDSDRMPANLFAKPPEKIVEVLSSREVFPQGAASGMRVLSFYISQSGKGLSSTRRRNLERAKKMLSALVEHELADKEKWRRKVA